MLRPPSIWLVIVAAALIAAAIAVPTVFFTHRDLMPTAAELQQLDDLVERQITSPSKPQRLSAPDRIELQGDVKIGYFTYVVSDAGGTRRLLVDWRIERGQVQIVSIKRL